MFTKKINFLDENNEIIQCITFADYNGPKITNKKIDESKWINKIDKKQTIGKTSFFDNLITKKNNIDLNFNFDDFHNHIDIHIPLFISIMQLTEILSAILQISLNNIYITKKTKKGYQNCNFIKMDYKKFYSTINKTHMTVNKFKDKREFIINMASFTPIYQICTSEKDPLNEIFDIDIKVFKQNENDKEFNIFTNINSLQNTPQLNILNFINELSKSLTGYEKTNPSFLILAASKYVDIDKTLIYDSSQKVEIDDKIFYAWKKIYKPFIYNRIESPNIDYCYLVENGDDIVHDYNINNQETMDYVYKKINFALLDPKNLYFETQNLTKNNLKIELNVLAGNYCANMINSNKKFDSFESQNNELNNVVDKITPIFKNYIVHGKKSILTNITIKKIYFKENSDIKIVKTFLNSIFAIKPEEIGATSGIYYIFNDITEYNFMKLFDDYTNGSLLNIYNYYITNGSYQSIENKYFAELKIKQVDNFVEIEMRKISTELYAKLIMNFLNFVFTKKFGYIEYENNNFTVSTKTNIKELINNDPISFGKINNNYKTRYSIVCQNKTKHPILTDQNDPDAIKIYNQTKINKLDYYTCKDPTNKYMNYTNQNGRCIMCCTKTPPREENFEYFYCKYKLENVFNKKVYDFLFKQTNQYAIDFDENVAPGKLCRLNSKMKYEYGNDANLYALSLFIYNEPLTFTNILKYINTAPIFFKTGETNTLIIDNIDQKNYLNSDYNPKLKTKILIKYTSNVFVIVYKEGTKGYKFYEYDFGNIDESYIYDIPLTGNWFKNNNIGLNSKVKKSQIEIFLKNNLQIDFVYVNVNTDKIVAFKIKDFIISTEDIDIKNIKLFETKTICYVDEEFLKESEGIEILNESINFPIYDDISAILYIISFYSCFVYKKSIFDDEFIKDLKKDGYYENNKKFKYGMNYLFKNGSVDVNQFKITEDGINFIKKKIIFDSMDFLKNNDMYENENFIKFTYLNE